MPVEFRKILNGPFRFVISVVTDYRKALMQTAIAMHHRI
jgi:hypothetical protein